MHTTQVTPGSSTEEHMNIKQDEVNIKYLANIIVTECEHLASPNKQQKMGVCG
jgi:hypothetical protein